MLLAPDYAFLEEENDQEGEYHADEKLDRDHKEIPEVNVVSEERERGKREIEALMADPAIYDNREVLLPLLEEDPALNKEIKELESRWEELHLELDEIESNRLTG